MNISFAKKFYELLKSSLNFLESFLNFLKCFLNFFGKLPGFPEFFFQ